jgi:hypothetical protein
VENHIAIGSARLCAASNSDEPSSNSLIERVSAVFGLAATRITHFDYVIVIALHGVGQDFIPRRTV